MDLENGFRSEIWMRNHGAGSSLGRSPATDNQWRAHSYATLKDAQELGNLVVHRDWRHRGLVLP